MSRSRKGKSTIKPGVVALAVVLFGVGYYMLNYLSTIETIILGSTFYIVIGCILIAISLMLVGQMVYKKVSRKKTKPKSKPVFLDKNEISKS